MLDLLKRGIDNNVICYDVDNQTGEITDRLVAIMKTVQLRKGEDLGLTHLLVPEGFASNKEIMGLKVVEDPTLSVDTYKSLSGFLPKDKTNLVMGYSENVEKDEVNVIMGAF